MPTFPFNLLNSQRSNPFLDFLEERPEYAIYSHIDELGVSNPDKEFLRRNQRDFQNEYLGRLGSQIRSGQAPTLRVNDFLGRFDFNKYLRSRAPDRMRGAGQAYTPRIRHLYGNY